MSTELLVKEATDVALSQARQDMGVSAKDLLLPKLYLMQNTSEAVGEELAKLGDIVTDENVVVGGLTNPIEIVPLKLSKSLMTYEIGGTSPKFVRKEVLTPALEALDWEGVEKNKDGQEIPIRRIICFDFCVLLKKDLLTEAFPTVITFKRTSLMAGKKLASHIFKLMALGKLPYSKSIELTVKKDKKDTNTYAVFQLGVSKVLSPDEMTVVETWNKILRESNVVVDDREEEIVDVSSHSAPLVTPTVMGGNAKVEF